MSTQFQPYLRQVEVLIGPLSELMGGGPEDGALRFFGDGSVDNLRISFSVEKQYPMTCSPSTIQIYNLSPGTRKVLHIPKTSSNIDKLEIGPRVIIRAGWKNGEMVKVFQGTLLACYHQRQGSDIVTNIMSYPGMADISTAIVPSPDYFSVGSGFDFNGVIGGVVRTKLPNGSYTEGTSLNEVVSTLAEGFRGTVVDKKNIVITEHFLGSGGWAFAGTAAEGLDKLSRQYGFSWWIDNGTFYAKDDKSVFPSQTVISSANGLLLRAEPMLTGPFSDNIGAIITSVLNPYINLGESLKVESTINPDLSGYYSPYSIRHTGDTHSEQWTTQIECKWYNQAR